MTKSRCILWGGSSYGQGNTVINLFAVDSSQHT